MNAFAEFSTKVPQVLLTHVFPAYLLGSIPFGYLFGRLKGIDIRKHGSGNIGATNVWRVLGRNWGLLTFALDFLKAILAVWLVKLCAEHVYVLLAVVFAVLGHNFPVWLRFKGGKGVATSAGGLCIWMPYVFLTVVGVWIVTFYTTRYVALASMGAAATLPLAAWYFYPHHPFWMGMSVFLGAMTIWTHRTNIQRLMNGTEHRFVKNSKS